MEKDFIYIGAYIEIPDRSVDYKVTEKCCGNDNCSLNLELVFSSKAIFCQCCSLKLEKKKVTKSERVSFKYLYEDCPTTNFGFLLYSLDIVDVKSSGVSYLFEKLKIYDNQIQDIDTHSIELSKINFSKRHSSVIKEIESFYNKSFEVKFGAIKYIQEL